MAKIKVQHLYGTKEQIEFLKEENDWRGRHVTRIKPPSADNNHKWELVVYPIPPKKRSRPKDEDGKDKNKRPRRGNGYNRFKEMSEE